MTSDGDERPNPAEERLLSLLLLLQSERRRLDASLTDVVMRKVRLQSAARGVARAISSLAVAIAEGLSVLLRIGPSSSRRRWL